ncbi:hypothetical protein [Chryseobacterium koreense]|uniref:Uncharacterized protein n=1 Tax=Chryseobacterium koreense CCUG 49689 TaxID=1304281 RepID=A0A0J7IXU7_9FLAO|nr:hypothetical protein [Chryseobacterium koreense]KMQ70827.1 hypothetical protein ACM44_09320 [Chryseobacterium koreense CCUG 49689]MBB5332533.1 hypothetical protein [Chryseobacterium koreense]
MKTSSYPFKAQLALKSDAELIETFNREVGNGGWGSARAEFLAALKQEFLNRSLCCSLIINGNSMSLSRRITMDGGVIRFA